MFPVLSEHRVFESGGEWTPKLSGDFQEGDPFLTKFTIEGRASIKELGGGLRAFFSNVKIVKRLIVVSQQEKLKMAEQRRQERKERRKTTRRITGVGEGGSEGKEGDGDPDSSSDEEESREKDLNAVEKELELERTSPVDVPRLTVFLTSKKPKTRMVDAHKTGSRLTISNTPDGIFGVEDVVEHYESPLRDIPDALNFQGIVVCKLPGDKPATEEPIIYALAKLKSSRALKIRTADALQLGEIAESLTKVLVGEAALMNAAPNNKKKAFDNIKSLKTYRKQAEDTFNAFQIPADEEVDFPTFLSMLDHLGMFMINAQAKRIFDAVDLQGDGTLGLSEFENFLIGFDILGSSGHDLVVMDVFDSLKTRPLTTLLAEETEAGEGNAGEAGKDKKAESKSKPAKPRRLAALADGEEEDESMRAGLDFSGFNEAIQMLGVKIKRKDAIKSRKKKKQKQQQGNKAAESNAGGTSTAVVGAPGEAVRKIADKGEDYDDDDFDDKVMAAFCLGGGIKIQDSATKYLNLLEFRRAWLQLADLKLEMHKRGMKYESGAFTESRNRERLSRAIGDIEEAYMSNLARINRIVEKVKQERRQKKDEKKRSSEAHREKLQHEANKFIAVRSQEKRLLAKKEQEERAKKRLEEKALRNKLLLKQQQQDAEKRAEILAKSLMSEKLRIDEIRQLGLDVIDHSVRGLRFMPPSIYADQEAQIKLTYALSVDFSHNELDALPEQNFLYWLNEARQLKLAQNRLKTIPDDLKNLVKLEILELGNNRLESLPPGLGNMTSLQRLDLANNHLRTLPGSLGSIATLKYLNLHSNHLTVLPVSIGSCTSLQYIDASRNALVELPEDVGYLKALTHLDLTGNQLAKLPHNLGLCSQLSYLDISTNFLTALPDTFSKLSQLQVFNAENNSINTVHSISLPSAASPLSSHKQQKNKNDSSSNKPKLPKKPKPLSEAVDDANESAPEAGKKSSSTGAGATETDKSAGKLVELDSMGREMPKKKKDLGESDARQGWFNNLQSLRSMNMRRNKIEALFHDIGGAVNLTLLDLSVNQIEYLPPEIGLLTCLQELKLPDNKLTDLPVELGSCISLQRLELKKNAIEGCLPDTIGLVRTLEFLDVSFNRISTFPRSIIGLRELVEIRAEQCWISELPDTITFLDKLQILHLRSNQFTRFPIELNAMKSLKTLNLANNAISLLPRNIASITNVQALDLSQNKLRALPVEFTDVLEGVEVQLHSNPWTDYPPRWAQLWWPDAQTTEEAAAVNGYNLSNALDILYAMRAFYDTAESIWTELGVYHYTGRLGLEDFLQELRERIPKTFHEGLVPYVKHLYFESRRTGAFVRWYLIEDAAMAEEDARRRAQDAARREFRVQRSRADVIEKEKRAAKVYESGGDMVRRIRQVNELSAEHQKNEEVLHHMAMTALFHSVQEAEKEMEQKRRRNEKRLERIKNEELSRLYELLDADAKGRKEARKRDRQKDYALNQKNAIAGSRQKDYALNQKNAIAGSKFA